MCIVVENYMYMYMYSCTPNTLPTPNKSDCPVLLSPTITIVQTHENQKSYLRKILQLNDSCLNEFILNYYT